MRRLIAYYRAYWVETGSPGYLLSILVLAGLLVYANYAGALEAHWVRSVQGWPARFLRAFLLYALPYWLAFGFQYLFYKEVDFHRYRRWRGVLLAAPILFALQSTLPLHTAGLALLYAVRSSCLILPIVLFWVIRDRERQPLYGLRRPDTWSYYPVLLVLMVPLLLYAAAQPDFLAMYPRARVLSDAALHGSAPHGAVVEGAPSPLRLVLFEGSYGMDIFSMEFFFRGFLIFGLLRVCKAQAILPMALFYCVAHFGKPMAECISSLFGGWILGIIAYKSRSIYVGVLLHLCLAWGLEVLAALH